MCRAADVVFRTTIFNLTVNLNTSISFKKKSYSNEFLKLFDLFRGFFVVEGTHCDESIHLYFFRCCLDSNEHN